MNINVFLNVNMNLLR